MLPAIRHFPEPVETGPADRNPAVVYLSRLTSPASRASMRQALRTLARLLGAVDPESAPWHTLRYPHTAAIRARLAEAYAPATANQMLCALRGVLREAWRLGLMGDEDYHRARDVAAVKGSALPAGRAARAEEVGRLMQACRSDPGPAGARDAALLAILFGAGLRRAEAAALMLSDYRESDRLLLVRVGKGRRGREVPIGDEAAAAICAWIAVRGSEPGALLCRVNRGGRIAVRALTPQAVRNALGKRSAAAGVPGFSPHSCRRTYVTGLLEAGVDIATVADLAGHANVQTTRRYDRRGDEARRRAAGLVRLG